MRYTRQVRLTREVGPIAGRSAAPGAAERAIDRTAARRREASTTMASARSVEASRSPVERKRSVVAGWRGVLALAVCLMLAASVAMASTPMSQPGIAANGGTAVAAIAVTPSPSPAPSESPSPSPQPSPSGPATAQPRVGTPIPGSAFLSYTVQGGDTLNRIANSFGLSPTTLYWANSGRVADPQLVKIGWTLMIPPMDGLTVTVEAGATIKTIADKYGIDPQQLTDANSLTDTNLVTGQLLLVPGADTPPLPVKQAPTVVPNWKGKLKWPVVGKHPITQLFGCTGWYGEPRWGRCAHFHDGLDIGAKTGTPVLAAASGTVIYAGWRKRGTDGAAGGIVVWISHGGGSLYTTYNHLSAATVKIGQRVSAGQQIGRVGATGAAVGAHLHFEVWIAYPWSGGNIADARDPLLYAKKP